ncbi:MAG: methyltransferase domain-containing protein [Coriobacteriales bacterium]
MAFSLDDLAAYYAQLPENGGLDSRCGMFVPGGLDDQVALDLACRKGLGVYKLSDHVGPAGRVFGVDWREPFVESAREGEAHAAQKNGLATSNMEFIVAYPELIDQIGIEEGSVDYVYVNSALNLFYDPAHVIKLIGHLLKPAGKLVCQTVLAIRPRDREIMAEARSIGNAVQAAPFRKDFARWLHGAGMDMPTYETIESRPIAVDAAAAEDTHAPFVITPEDPGFISCTVSVEKLGGFDYQAFLRDDIAQFR